MQNTDNDTGAQASTCGTCGGDGIVITWVHSERWDGREWHDVDPERHDLCSDCTKFYGPTPPWADLPGCPECKGLADMDGDSMLCWWCAHRWDPSADEVAQAAAANEADRKREADYPYDDIPFGESRWSS